MTKIVTIPLHEENIGFSAWAALPNKLDGFHSLKDSPLIQFSVCNTCYGVPGLNPQWFSSEVELIQDKVDKQVYGISENAMLAAIAIAQDPALATTILAMQKKKKN